MRKVLLVASVAVMATLPLVAQSGRKPTARPTSEEYERMERVLPLWVRAASAHEPGVDDAYAREISAWSGSDLEAVLKGIHVVLHQGYRLSPFLPQKDVLAAIAKRGTLLHADIALLVPPDPARPPSPLPSSRQMNLIVQFSDARQYASWYGSVHLEVGRVLLDLLRQTEWRDDRFASLWYQATTVALLRRTDLADADPHLDRAVQVLDHDAPLLFYAGVLHEEYACGRWQRMLEGAVLPSRFKSTVGSERSELQQAEKFLTRSLNVDPAASEVRLHRARVRGLLGRHSDAAAELRQLAAEPGNPVLLYYAWLFLGAEEAALGHRAPAAEAFEHAAVLFPAAQSPIIALSELARRFGDRPGAQAALQRLFALPAREDQRIDPWWQYFRAHTGNADLLVGVLRSLFRGGTE